jgi:hypothetical protein
LRAGEENQQILFNHVEEEVVKNSRLVSENERLKDQLENAARDPAFALDADPTPEKVVASSSTVSAEEHHGLVDKYNELSRKFQDLSQKIKYLERKNNAVMQKNKDMKESVRAWQEYADRQSGRQKPKNGSKADDIRPRLSVIPQINDARPCMPSSPGSIATVRTPLSLADTERSSPAPISSSRHSKGAPEPVVSPTADEHHENREAGNRGGSVTPKPSRFIRLHPPQQKELVDMPLLNVPSDTLLSGNVHRRLPSYLRTTNPSSSQTTEDESTEHAMRHANYTRITDRNDDNDDDEVPQFVSARSLKRKRVPSSRVDFYGDRSSDGTPVKPIRVKDEHLSSPPIIHNLLRKETIDLDVPTSTVLQTPRHIKLRSPIQSRHHRSSSAPITQEAKQEDTRFVQVFTKAVSDEVVIHEPETANTEIRAYSEPSDLNEIDHHVLRGLDPNTVTIYHEERSEKRRKGKEKHREDVHDVFAEAGDEPPPIDENDCRLAPSVARVKLNRKMHSSSGVQLSAISAHKSPKSTTAKIKVEQDPTPPSSSARMVQTPPARTSPRHPLFEYESGHITTGDHPQWRMKVAEVHPSVRKSGVLPPRKQGQLRSKPVSQLSVQDFRPNPVYNQGYTYAFSETVRKRSDRLCLPGCTNPQCCGSTFRTFAEAQAPLPLSQEEALLEDYLGDAYNNGNMTQISTNERRELVLQARTKKLAKDAGKHREAYERRQTPPGYWRVDFPTTQELQEDRDRAKELEKKAVQVRWLEAQRKGGKWIFRDE